MKTNSPSTFRSHLISAFNFLLSALHRPSVLWLLFFALAAGASAATRYVDVNSANPSPPYTTWATAARVIQDAVDAAAPGDTVLVSNGLYNTGGRTVGTDLLQNRVAIEKAIRLESVNGPAVTIIEGARAPAGDEYGNGDGAVRCVYLGLTNAVGLFIWRLVWALLIQRMTRRAGWQHG